MSLRPRSLPKARDQTIRHLNDPTMPIRALTGADNQHGLDTTASHLAAAELYWVAPDMAALAMSAGGQLAAARWATADRPSPCGLIVFDGGIGHIDANGVEIPVEALAWGPDRDNCLISMFISRHRLQREIDQIGVVDVEKTPPLMPVRSFILPIADPVSMADLPEGAPTPVLAALAAAWLIMEQPTLVDHTRVRPDSDQQRADKRAGKAPSDVTIIDLRRQYVPDAAEPTDQPSRTYRYRWVVSGHWRDQAHGPNHSLRRQTWIPAYVKGPEGAPLLATERVNVWRR